MKWTGIILLALCASLATTNAASAQDKEKPAPTNAYALGARLDPAKPPSQDKATFRELKWDDLAPKNWDPFKELKGLDLRSMGDRDPRAISAMARLQEVWKNAPLNTELNGKRVRIAGFVVLLDFNKDGTREFLLVPYFGACVHTPPPPNNQIVHVVLAKPSKSIGMMNAVWISGTIKGERIETSMGTSGYQMAAELVEPYKQKDRSR